MEAKEVRIVIWENLLKVAKPDSRFSWQFSEFITDYEGSEDGAVLMASTEAYKTAKTIFITPDNNLEKFREIAFRDKKTVVMTNYGISRGFFLIKSGMVAEGREEITSLLDGVAKVWQFTTLENLKKEVGHIDLLVTGASAISTNGLRFGKGHGYFDLEWAMLYMSDIVDDSSVIFCAGHDCQVVDVNVEAEEYDTAIDWIITPTRIIETGHKYPRPKKGIIWSRLALGMKEQIPPIQELWWKINCR